MKFTVNESLELFYRAVEREHESGILTRLEAAKTRQTLSESAPEWMRRVNSL